MSRTAQIGNIVFGPNCPTPTAVPGTGQWQPNYLPMQNWNIQQGWQCPVCKSVMAPTQPFCVFCSPKKTEIKETTNG